MRQMVNNGLSILVIRLSALGDVAMTIPAIYSVARAYPRVGFTVVTDAFASHLFINVPDNVRVIGMSARERRGIKGTMRLLKLLYGLKVDAVADLHNVVRSWVADAFMWLRGKRVVMVDKGRKERTAILGSERLRSRLFTERYFDTFAKLGLVAAHDFETVFSNGLPELPNGFTNELPHRQKEFSQTQGVGKCLRVGIAPFARYENKVYDLALMHEVVSKIAGLGHQVFLFGARGNEAETLQKWAEADPNVVSVAGRWTLEEELAVMARMEVMVTMDSANMHLASLVGTRVVSLWGSTTPACGFLGYGQDERDALYGHLDCQPCSIGGSRTCPLGHEGCRRAVEPDLVVRRLLQDDN